MITVIILTLLGVAVGNYFYRNDDSKYKDAFLPHWLGFIIGVFFGAFVAFLIPAKTELIEKHETIEALQDNSSTSGSFFLGCGQINGEMKYVMYVKDGNRFTLKQIDYRGTQIEYTDSLPEVISFSTEKIKGETINKFALIIREPKTYLIKVPKGTIKNNYNLDAN